MKIYEIRNKNNIYGYFYCNDVYEDCYIDLIEGLEEYPIFFNMFIENKKYTINEYWTLKWIKERVIPYERQNIVEILKSMNEITYNEIKIFIKQKGKSSMDDNYLKLINKSNEFIDKRKELLIKDFIRINNNQLIVFFNNGKTKVFKYENNNDIPFLYLFGNEIIFNVKIRYDYLEIYNKGVDIDFSYNNLIEYINENIYTAKKVEETLNISKQSVYNLKNKEDIISLNNNLFIKNNIKRYK